MAIFPQTAAMILKEHSHRSITGTVLLVGRQTVMLTFDEVRALLATEGVPLREDFVQEIDLATVSARNTSDYITDSAFFSMFCDAKIIALDVSAFEGAEIVHDLNVLFLTSCRTAWTLSSTDRVSTTSLIQRRR